MTSREKKELKQRIMQHIADSMSSKYGEVYAVEHNYIQMKVGEAWERVHFTIKISEST